MNSIITFICVHLIVLITNICIITYNNNYIGIISIDYIEKEVQLLKHGISPWLLQAPAPKSTSSQFNKAMREHVVYVLTYSTPLTL